MRGVGRMEYAGGQVDFKITCPDGRAEILEKYLYFIYKLRFSSGQVQF